MTTTPPAGFDERRFKALERNGFNRIAARYADGAWLRASLQAALLEAAALAPGEHVLDLAAGPGLLARDAARPVLPATSPRACSPRASAGQRPRGCPICWPPPATPSTWRLATAASTPH
jgi:hypothetical protein